MLNRDPYYNFIEDSLILLSHKIKNQNSVNLTSLNIHCENLFRDFLNCLFDYNLVNSNEIEQNAAAIDLGDIKNKICIQITSNNQLKKTKDTLRLFEKKKLYEKYDRLIILQIVKKAKHKITIVAKKIKFDKDNDIWDYTDLTKKCMHLRIEKLETLFKLVWKEFNVNPFPQSKAGDNTYIDESISKSIATDLIAAFRPPSLLNFFPNANNNVMI